MFGRHGRAHSTIARTRALGTAIHPLFRSQSEAAVVARGEAIARSVLDCGRAVVTLAGQNGAADTIVEPGASHRSVALYCPDGGALGRLDVWRAASRPFRAEEETLLAQLALAISMGMQSARLHVTTDRARADLDQVLAAISECVITLDAGFRITRINNAALHWLAAERRHIVGRVLFEVFPDTADGLIAEHCRRVIDSGIGAAVSPILRRRAAILDLRIDAFPDGLLLFFRDVTVERETEQMLRQSQKLDAIGQLTGGIAHDVNNMLTVIVGNLEILAERAEGQLRATAVDAAPEDTDLALATAALRAGESAAQLIARLLAYSRRQSLSPRVADVGGLLRSIEALLRRTLDGRIALRIRCAATLWHALLDSSEFESAVLNLALNAREAMQDGGTLEITAGNVQVDRVYAALSGIGRTGDFIVVSVADTGTGMTREVMERAFEPFFTTRGAAQGTGLGLSMVYGFARQSGGHATIDSEEGHGTIVRIYLPRATEPLQPASPLPATPDGGTEPVLLVEDNPLVREHTAAMLRSLGYSVSMASDGPEAMAFLQREERPDLLLTDVVLPGPMNGRDVADAVAVLAPGIRVLFTSGYAANVLLRDGRLPPGFALLSKPFRRAELARAVRTQLRAAPWRQVVNEATDSVPIHLVLP